MSYHLRRYKNSKYVYARITQPNGTRGNWHSTRKTTNREARRVAEQWDSVSTTLDRPIVTLDEAFTLLATQMDRKKNTDATMDAFNLKASHIRSFFGPTTDIDAIELEGTEAYYDKRHGHRVADSTIAKELTYLCAALKRCYELGKTKKHWAAIWPPFLPKSFPGRTRWLTFDEYERLCVALKEVRSYERQQSLAGRRKGGVERRTQLITHADPMGQDWSDTLTVYVFTGMRFKDIYALYPYHLDGDHLSIPGTKTRKAKRRLPLKEHVLDVLKRRAAEANGGPLFPMQSSTLDNQKRAWLRALSKACVKLKIEHASTNDLRRTFCTWCKHAGVEMESVIDWMGHVDSRMIRAVYAQPSDEHGRKEMAKFPSKALPAQIEQFDLN